MRYAKAFVALGMAGLTALAAAITDDTITTAEYIGIGLAVLTALGVYLAPNKPAEPPTPAPHSRRAE